jgi:phosphate:Na+ symporter
MEIILSVLGGLGLFLFALTNLSDTLKSILGEKAKKWIGKLTTNFFTAIITGTVITIILDSSSAVIIVCACTFCRTNNRTPDKIS